MPIKPDVVKQTLLALRSYKVSATRAEQLAREVERVNVAARDEAVRNDFNAQPTDFAVALKRMAQK